MKITVLVGNGFDISLGIKSSYGDFYRWYCAQKSDVKHIREFRRNIQDKQNGYQARQNGYFFNMEDIWSDFELGLGRYTSNFNPRSASQFTDCLADAQKNIADYLRMQQNKFSVNIFTEQSLRAFREHLVDFISDLPEATQRRVLGSINQHATEDISIQFITFNYTDSLEKVLAAVPRVQFTVNKPGLNTHRYSINRRVHHIHGKIGDLLVLGVDKPYQISNEALRKNPDFKKLMVKADNITANGQRWHAEAEKRIADSKVVCVYGLSLGASDATWWKQLAVWLSARSDRHLVLFWYDAQNVRANAHQLLTVEFVKAKFLEHSYDLTEEQKNEIINRIHVVINTEKFLALEKKTDYVRC